MLAKELDLGPCGEEAPTGWPGCHRAEGTHPLTGQPGAAHAGGAAGNNDFTACRRTTGKMAFGAGGGSDG